LKDNNVKKYVMPAKAYKENFQFLSDGTNICNVAYHMQFIEHCFREKQNLERTTKSLMNRSIIIELASIIEVCLHEILSCLNVEVPSKKQKPLNISKTATLGQLLPLAVYYELISADLKGDIKKLNEHRNSVHFERYKKKRILEYNYYTDKMVEESIKIFVEFIKTIHSKIKGGDKTFLWPWDL